MSEVMPKEDVRRARLLGVTGPGRSGRRRNCRGRRRDDIPGPAGTSCCSRNAGGDKGLPENAGQTERWGSTAAARRVPCITLGGGRGLCRYRTKAVVTKAVVTQPAGDAATKRDGGQRRPHDDAASGAPSPYWHGARRTRTQRRAGHGRFSLAAAARSPRSHGRAGVPRCALFASPCEPCAAGRWRRSILRASLKQRPWRPACPVQRPLVPHPRSSASYYRAGEAARRERGETKTRRPPTRVHRVSLARLAASLGKRLSLGTCRAGLRPRPEAIAPSTPGPGGGTPRGPRRTNGRSARRHARPPSTAGQALDAGTIPPMGSINSSRR